MDKDAFFKMVDEECAAAHLPLVNEPIEPSTNGSSEELRAYLRKMDDDEFLKEQVDALITELVAILPVASSK